MLKSKGCLLWGVAACMLNFPVLGNAMWHKKTTITEEWGPGPALTARRGSYQHSAEDLIQNYWRIQLFSFPKTQGKLAAHQQLEEMRKKAPHITHYTALIASEGGSNWLRGQIGPFSNQAAASNIQASLRQIFPGDSPTTSAPGVVHQPGFNLESAELHIWQ